MREKSHYEILEVSPRASLEDIKAAYRAKAMATHPDVNAGDDAGFLLVRDAYKILVDNNERRQYDLILSLMWDACPGCSGRGVKYKQKGFTTRIPIICDACNGVGFFSRSK